MNWKHSFIEIFSITVGQSFLVDEAYRLLLEAREDRLFSIASSEVEQTRAKANLVDNKHTIELFNKKSPLAGTKADVRRSEANIKELHLRTALTRPCYSMARAELEFIERLLEYIKPNLKFPEENFFQEVQVYEYAFEYALSLLTQHHNLELIRNVECHPLCNKIWNVFDSIQAGGNTSMRDLYKTVNTKLCAELDIEEKHRASSLFERGIHNEMIESLDNILLIKARDTRFEADSSVEFAKRFLGSSDDTNISIDSK